MYEFYFIVDNNSILLVWLNFVRQSLNELLLLYVKWLKCIVIGMI